MRRKITKKLIRTFLMIISVYMLLAPLSIKFHGNAEDNPRSPGLIFGTVHYSADGLAKIYEGANWSCINITAYCIEEYVNGTIDLAVDNDSVDEGNGYPEKSRDEFRFNPLYQWKDENFDKEHIAVGENEINGDCYVFITSFFYTLGGLGPTGRCNDTEWELIPAPKVNAKGASWINISIPKFKNPQKASYGNLTTNTDNTIGFAIYRSETNNSWTLNKNYLKIGNAIHSDDDCYFNDTNLSSGRIYYYAVAPIAKGGYITYGKSFGTEADLTAPYIITYTGNDTYITTTENITVVFSEEMNKTSVESAFNLEDSSGSPVNGTFSWTGNAMSFVPNETLTPNMNYIATVNATAKDKSDPSNALDKDYSWSFIAIQGRGDFVVDLDIPPSPEKGKTYTITATVCNTGGEAFNIGGFLTAKFYESPDGETWTLIDTKYIQSIWKGNSSSASTMFTFSDYGSYYFRVEVTSNNPIDTFPGGEKTGRASAYVNIPQPGKEIGLGPYVLIALIVVIAIVIGLWIIASYRKGARKKRPSYRKEIKKKRF